MATEATKRQSRHSLDTLTGISEEALQAIANNPKAYAKGNARKPSKTAAGRASAKGATTPAPTAETPVYMVGAGTIEPVGVEESFVDATGTEPEKSRISILVGRKEAPSRRANLLHIPPEIYERYTRMSAEIDHEDKIELIKQFDELFDSEEESFKGSYEDTMVEGLHEAVIPLIRDQIEEHICFDPAIFGDYLVVIDNSNVEVRKWEITTINLPDDTLETKRVLRPITKNTDLKLFFENKKIFWPVGVDKQKSNKIKWQRVNPYDIWVQSRHRPSYDRVIFAPRKWGEQAIGIPEGTLNLFQGWPLQPDMGSHDKCKLIRQHILKTLCNGDQGLYRWMITWLAWKVQKPHVKIGTSIALRSRQGMGKGIIITNVIGKILGNMFRHLISIDSIIGRFNSGYEDTNLLYLDEAFITRDKSVSAKLKGLITENEVTSERKYKDPTTYQISFDLIIATNFDVAAPLETDDRRYTVIEIDDENQSGDYFNRLSEEIENGGREAFFGFLLEWDIHNPEINIRKPCETKSRVHQKLLNLDPLEQWWHSVLLNGTFGILSNTAQYDWPADCEDEYVPRSLIVDAFNQYTKTRKVHNPPGDVAVTRKIKILCPSLMKRTDERMLEFSGMWKGIGASRQRAYCLPDLESARADFENYISGKVDWGDGEGQDKQNIQTSPEFADVFRGFGSEYEDGPMTISFPEEYKPGDTDFDGLPTEEEWHGERSKLEMASK